MSDLNSATALRRAPKRKPPANGAYKTNLTRSSGNAVFAGPPSPIAVAADYMDRANKQLADFLASYCVKGKVKVSVALVRSSINPQADDAEVAAKRLSDWLPVEVVFKNPHPKC